MAHANAALTPRQRLRLARAVVEDGWTVAYAAAVFQVTWPTAKRWVVRYEQAGAAGMVDRSSRPHRCPRRTPRPLVRRIVHLRWRHRLGPVEIAARLGVPASTVYAVLRRCRINRLAHIDRRTGEPARRYEHERPGSLLHVDVKKLGNIPDGGGWRYVGRAQGKRNRAATAGAGRSVYRQPKLGTAFVHRARRPQPGRLRRDP
jgi:transposase